MDAVDAAVALMDAPVAHMDAAVAHMDIAAAHMDTAAANTDVPVAHMDAAVAHIYAAATLLFLDVCIMFAPSPFQIFSFCASCLLLLRSCVYCCLQLFYSFYISFGFMISVSVFSILLHGCLIFYHMSIFK